MSTLGFLLERIDYGTSPIRQLCKLRHPSLAWGVHPSCFVKVDDSAGVGFKVRQPVLAPVNVVS